MTNKELKKELYSKNTDNINRALNYISEYGNHEIIPDLITLLQSNKNDLVQEKLIEIFENLRDKESLIHIINALIDSKFKDIRAILVSTCWKNSLDYNDYVEVFTDIFIDSDFYEAFDALTVIENMNSISEENASKCILKLENHLEDAKDIKKSIIYELIKIIHSHAKNPAE